MRGKSLSFEKLSAGPASFEMQRSEIEYLSVGANRRTSAADWNRRGVLAFGADVNVALWQPHLDPPRGVESILSGHKAAVRAVQFLPELTDDESSYLLTSGDDTKLIVWKKKQDETQFVACHVCNAHTGAINCIAAVRAGGDGPRWIIACGAADVLIRLWIFEREILELSQIITTTPKFIPLALSLTYLAREDGTYVLAAAGTRDTVQIYTSEVDIGQDPQFDLQASLAGHEGWIRSLSFTRETKQSSDLLLASASQDKYIRIWRLHQHQKLPTLAASKQSLTNDPVLQGAKSPANKTYQIKAASRTFSVTFEALLLGHEDWIYSSKWKFNHEDKLQLLSASADNTLAIWEADASSGIWINTVRLGEISREKGATTATGSTGGFWTGLWSPDGKSVACLGRSGSWRRWRYDAKCQAWQSCVAISGHTRAVTGIAWSRTGHYLLSTSSDQTTRLHCQWKTSGANSWHEMSRAQIHGYDLNCIDSLGDSQFVSGADEKLMRVFDEPQAVAFLLCKLGGIGNLDFQNMPAAANIPVLGLSNKAIDIVNNDQEMNSAEDSAPMMQKSDLEMDHPPLEDTLSRHTLWPETEKLYGHGYELSCLATGHDSKLIASACKASSGDHAVVRMFETERWTEIRPPLAAHSLTATRLRFSADDEYLLSVGRDRQWAVFQRNAGDAKAYQMLQSNPKGHSRMILDAAWAPFKVPLFATAGRDKNIRLWSPSQGGGDKNLRFSQVVALPKSASVTAVDFLPCLFEGKAVLASGTETGSLDLSLVNSDASEVTPLPTCPLLNTAKAILQLSWRPTPQENGRFHLAVAGEDSSLRLFAFDEAFMRPSEIRTQ